jgi:gamma-glutamylcyclotransferase (GGCT)/AIG2-like uncharacterized protein YtfP
MEDATIRLFSYGTLRLESVQLATFGRRLEGRPDVLPGYRLSPVRITDPHVIAVSGADTHTIARPSGDPADRIAGTVFEITPAELDAADRYEVGDYERIRVQLESGAEAFLYVAGPEPSDRP